jgi:hypothetical protein
MPSLPMLEAIQTLNHRYSLEVVSRTILDLDSGTAETEARLNNFVDCSQIPMLTMNLLQALPKTPLRERIVRDGCCEGNRMPRSTRRARRVRAHGRRAKRAGWNWRRRSCPGCDRAIFSRRSDAGLDAPAAENTRFCHRQQALSS